MNEQKNMLWELNELMSCIHQVDLNLAIEQIPDQVLLLMGQTKAGKTTLLYYLLKKKLIYQVDEQLHLPVIKAEVQFLNAQIGNNFDSTTVYPNIPPETDENCLIIDMPGLKDTRPLFRLLNIYIIQETIKKIKSVHVSIVIPFQNLEGDSLMIALQNTCNLFNPDFLKQERCKSFILTKIENEEDDKTIFDETMKYLQEEVDESEDGSSIASVLNSYASTNTYIFSNKQPDQEQGGLLKEKIIRQNNFYEINETQRNILSDSYAETIVGRGNIEQFNLFALGIMQQITLYLPSLIELFGDLIKFHHFKLLKECCKWQFQLQSLRQAILVNVRRLPIGLINQKALDLEETQHENRSEELLSLMYKIQRTVSPKEETEPEYGANFVRFVEFSNFLAKEKSGISQELRTAVSLTFKNCHLILRTVGEVKEEEIQKKLKKFDLNVSEHQDVFSSIRAFNNVFEDSELIKAISLLPEVPELMSASSLFKEFIVKEVPNFTITEVIKTIKQTTNDKLKKEKWQKSIAEITTRSSEQGKGQIKASKQIVKSLVPNKSVGIDQLYERLSTIQDSKDSLQQALSSIAKLREKAINEPEIIAYQSQLWAKTASMLSNLLLFEEAILFYLGIPNEIEVELLIQTAINFGQLNENFVLMVLLPYYSKASFSFVQIERLFNYLSLQATSIDRVIELEEKYVITIKKMRESLQDSKGMRSIKSERFNYSYVMLFLEKQGMQQLLKKADKNEKRIKSSKLTGKSFRSHFSKLDLTQQI